MILQPGNYVVDQSLVCCGINYIVLLEKNIQCSIYAMICNGSSTVLLDNYTINYTNKSLLQGFLLV